MALKQTWQPEQPLPTYADKATAAAIITHHFFPIEPPPLKWSAPIVRKAEDLRWPLRDQSPKRLS